MSRLRELLTPAELRPDASFSLGCRVSVKGGFFAPQQTTYSGYRFPVQRPRDGERHGSVACPRCGDMVPYSVLSVDDALRRRRNCRAAWIVTGAALLVVPVVIMIVMSARGDNDWVEVFPLLVPGIGCVLAALFHPPSIMGITSRKPRGQHMLAR